MTIVQPIQIQVAQKIFEAWDKLGVKGRADKLQQTLYSFTNEQRKMAAWQIDNAKQSIADTRLMPGPTGERNELSNQGRGVFLCMSLIEGDNARVGLVGQVFAALIAGNPVITVGPTGQEIMDMISPFASRRRHSKHCRIRSRLFDRSRPLSWHCCTVRPSASTTA